MRAAIYARVSTEDQAKHGYSLPDQIASCKTYLQGLGYHDIIEYVDDGYSGEYIDRPAISNLRDDADEGRINIVAVYDPDRLARKLFIQLLISEELERNNVKLHFVTGQYDSSPEGRLFFSMRGAVAEFEKEKIRERSMRGKRKKAQDKKLSNSNLFGYDYIKETKSYKINPDQAAIIKDIYNRVVEHQDSVVSIQTYLKDKAIPSPTGKAIWPTSTIYRILKNHTYTGVFASMKIRQQKTGIKSKLITHRPENEWINIPVPEIIPEELFNRTQAQLDRNKIKTKRPMMYPYLLSGILYCGVCGRRMVAHHCAFRDGSYKPYYQCLTQRNPNLKAAGFKCESRSLPANAIDQDIWTMLMESFLDPEKAKKYMPKQEIVDHSSELEKITKLETELIKRRETIARWFRQQILPEAEAEKELTAINSQLNTIKSRKDSLAPVIISQNKPSFASLAKNMRLLVDQGELTKEQKRKIITATISKITVTRIDNHSGKGSRSKPPIFKIVWETV
ncbi:recombinase family protein [Pelosinus sp. IPA-1]|uniref:recombinase family protein n=1 Tax=Pelosinus sp. IPA-1 TaxID=3029569 RepID=UPI00243618F7|nr:recombinase family protein [Pelosinus sp. IPA-1]GMB00396.1 putative DNA recombinase [Pelosinus sp. IPA-1]